MRVVLMDCDKVSQHASGEIDYEKIADATSVERNGHKYNFNVIHDNIAYYVEVKQNYIITEF